METPRVEVRDLARNHWPDILSKYGLTEAQIESKRKEVGCPACGGNTRFRFDNKEGRGTFFCSHCGAGDGFKLLELLGIPFKEAAQNIRDYFEGQPVTLAAVSQPAPPPIDDAAENARIRANLLRTWKGSKLVTAGDPVWKYLVKTRQLPITGAPRCIRYHPGLKYFDEDFKLIGTYPVMLTAVTDGAGKPAGLHRTYLTSDGQKAPVEMPKKLMKTCGVRGGAIRLATHGKRLAIAEGIETAFAVMAITKIPCWATVSATLMPNVIIPAEVEEVFIFADNDLPDKNGKRAGQDAANALAERLRAEGRKVFVTIPAQSGIDFHDIYLQRQEQQAQKQRKKSLKRQAKATEVAA